jgi:hypothetical protein
MGGDRGQGGTGLHRDSISTLGLGGGGLSSAGRPDDMVQPFCKHMQQSNPQPQSSFTLCIPLYDGSRMSCTLFRSARGGTVFRAYQPDTGVRQRL